MNLHFLSSPRLIYWLLPVALTLVSCASAPSALQGQFSTLSPAESATTTPPPIGTQVRWGGRIIETLPENGRTCFQILARPLGSSGRPSSNTTALDSSQGRFLACRAGFHDPAVYQPGRDVTVIGEISAHPTVKIGEYDYILPQLNASVVYLWPPLAAEKEGPRRDPYYYPYGPWGPWGHPWYPWAPYGWW